MDSVPRPPNGFICSLTADDFAHYEQSYGECRRSFEQEGYRTVTFPVDEFPSSDFLDPGHFMAAGGYKIAVATAAIVRRATATHSGRFGMRSSTLPSCEFVVVTGSGQGLLGACLVVVNVEYGVKLGELQQVVDLLSQLE